MTDREKALKRVQICDFALTEAVLYLDGHPKNKKALEYFDKYKMLREQAVNEYQGKYGLLSSVSNNNPNEWEWIKSPWPWEMEDK